MNRLQLYLADYFGAQLKQGLQGITMKLFSKIYGWTPEKVEMFLVSLRKELDDNNHHLLDYA
jgi:hypothetical protein